MFLFVSPSERTFPQQRRLHKTRKGLETEEQALDCSERMKIRFYIYIQMPLKDGGGMWRGIV